MDTREAGRLGAAITNSKLTKEGRSRAAKKGWEKRKSLIKNAEVIDLFLRNIAHHD